MNWSVDPLCAVPYAQGTWVWSTWDGSEAPGWFLPGMSDIWGLRKEMPCTCLPAAYHFTSATGGRCSKGDREAFPQEGFYLLTRLTVSLSRILAGLFITFTNIVVSEFIWLTKGKRQSSSLGSINLILEIVLYIYWEESYRILFNKTKRETGIVAHSSGEAKAGGSQWVEASLGCMDPGKPGCRVSPVLKTNVFNKNTGWLFLYLIVWIPEGNLGLHLPLPYKI